MYAKRAGRMVSLFCWFSPHAAQRKKEIEWNYGNETCTFAGSVLFAPQPG
jgi:hypothetical protein